MTRTGTPRLAALDLLRGASVAAMIVVNNPGNWNAVYPQLTHAAWHGLTCADLVFPLFIYIMGVTLGLRTPGLSPAARRADDVRRIVVRGAWLVALGLLLNLAASWHAPFETRLPGVLQRIGLTYMAAAVITERLTPKGQWLAMASLLVAQSLLLAGGGSLAPGLNIGAVLDHAVFGSHLLTPFGDPEGLIGWPTSVVTALLGAASGRLFQVHAAPGAPTRPRTRLVAMAVAAVAGGAVVSLLLPVNKALWTASFTLITAGVAALLLWTCLGISGSRVEWATTPFRWLGTNPLAIYFLSELTTTALQQPFLPLAAQAVTPKDWLFWDLLVPLTADGGGPASSLLYASLYAAMWAAVAGVLYRRGIRLRV